MSELIRDDSGVKSAKFKDLDYEPDYPRVEDEE